MPSISAKARIETTRSLVAKLSRVSKNGLLTVDQAAKVMGVDKKRVAMKLASLVRSGWLERARRGLYFILPLEAIPGQKTTTEDPWVLARELFSPCYIGGWSAAEHWGLTEQLFRSTLVVTAANVRERSLTILGNEFRLFQVDKTRIKGTELIWRGTGQVAISDKERTIIDGLRNPELCGGMGHVIHIMSEYSKSSDYNFQKVIIHAQEANSGAVWKRLGYLTESLWPDEKKVIQKAHQNLTSGNIKLDPNVKNKGSLVSKWRIWVNVKVRDNE